jgi:hypothetical protein
MLVERAFGKRRKFADSPTARWLGFGLRVGGPALPLLRSEHGLMNKQNFCWAGSRLYQIRCKRGIYLEQSARTRKVRRKQLDP